MLNFKSNMQVAHALLSVINSRISEDMDFSRFHVEAYSNGREQGYCIKGWSSTLTNNISISFSEHRSSDNIVIYFGESTDFSMQGNVPNEKVYAQAKHFKHNEPYEAASFIIKKMRAVIAASEAVESPAVAV